MRKMNITCPNCGTTIEIKATEASSQPTTTFHAKNVNKAETKIEALKAAGVNVSNLFSICGKNGDYEVGRLNDGCISILPDNDPIFAAIQAEGAIPNRRLFRRWIMAQVFHMMTQKDWCKNEPISFTEALHRKGYRYQWEMMVEETRVQTKLYINDPENFKDRNRWFNDDVVRDAASEYIHNLERTLNELPRKRCKGIPYVTLGGRNIFCSDIEQKVLTPIRRAYTDFLGATQPAMLYTVAKDFYDTIRGIYLPYDMPQAKAFVDAYKGAGAYYTLKNLIMFHGCTFPYMTTEGSLIHLGNIAGNHSTEGWRLFGIMKGFLSDNHIDIEKKMREWQK